MNTLTRGRAKLSLSRAIISMAQHKLDSEDHDVLARFAQEAGLPFDSARPFLPFAALRALTAGEAASGGYLSGQLEAVEPALLLAPFSVTARLGASIQSAGAQDAVLPVEATPPQVQWLGSELTEATPSTPTLRSVAFVPKTAAAVIGFSRQLAKQTDAENFVRRSLLRAAGIALDQGAIAGSGSAGQPLGVLNTPGIQTIDGTNFSFAKAREMLRRAAAADTDDEGLRWVGSPTVRELLQGVEAVTDSARFLWDSDAILGRRAHVSTNVPAGPLVLGDWRNLVIKLWPPGFELNVNPYGVDPESDFRSGRIGARILLGVDVGISHPDAFISATTVS